MARPAVGAWTPPHWAMECPVGTEYHRLARNARHRWWRPLLGTLLLVPLFVAGAILVFVWFAMASLATGTSMSDTGDAAFTDPVWEYSYGMVTIAVALPLVLGVAWAVQRRRVGTVSSVAGRLRWRWLAACVGVAVPILLLVVVALAVLSPVRGESWRDMLPGADWVGWRTFAIGTGAVLLLTPFQAAAEEYLFRGWILQTVGAWLRSPWWGIVPGALLFALAHGLSEPSGFVLLAMSAILSGWLAVRTGGLEAAIALHVVNNLVFMVQAAAFGQLATETTAADATWDVLAIFAVTEPLYAVLVVLLARAWMRRGQLSALSPAPAEQSDLGAPALPRPRPATPARS